MLKILNNGKYLPVARKDNFNIVTNYEGEQTLSFDVYVKDEIYNLIVEEADICFRDCTYRVNLPVKTTVNSGFNVIKIAKMYSISNKKVTRPRLKNLDFLYLIV